MIKKAFVILIFLFLSQVLLAYSTPSQENIIELGYDDGEPENYYTWIISDAMFLVKFSVNSSAFKLSKIKIYGFYTYTTERTHDATFEVEIFDENMKRLYSKKFVYSEYFEGLSYDEIEKISDEDKLFQLLKSVSKWAEITLDDLIVGSTFYVGVHACTKRGLTDAVWIGVDETNPQHKCFLYSPERDWKQLYGFNFMVRIQGSIIYKVEIEAINLPDDIKVNIRVTGTETRDYTINPGITETIFCEGSCSVEVLTPEYVYERTRYICKNTKFEISGSEKLLLEYTKEFLLRIEGIGEIVVNGEKIKLDGVKELWIPSGSLKLSIPEKTILIGENKRYIFKELTIDGESYKEIKEIEVTIKKPVDISLKYDLEYRIKVVSDHGKVSGDGWYKRDETTEICVLNPVIETQSIIYQFEYWLDNNGNKYYEDCIKVKVSEPLTLRAVWSEKEKSPIIFFVAIALAAILAILVVVYIVLRAKKKKETLPIPPPPPPLDFEV